MQINFEKLKNPQWIYDKITGYIFGIILLFTTLSLLIGAFRLFNTFYCVFLRT